MPKIFPEDITRDRGQDQKNVGSPIETLVNTVSHMQRDLAILRDENRALRTPATSQVGGGGERYRPFPSTNDNE